MKNQPITRFRPDSQKPPIMSGAAASLKSSASELDLDRPNIEDYLPSGSSIQEPTGKLRL